MNEMVIAFQNELYEIAKEIQKFCFMSRAKEFQEESCKKLDVLREQASELKKQMIASMDEDSANAMLSLEEMIKALSNELKMWIAIKEDDPNLAWDLLISVQGAAEAAMRAHDLAGHLQGYIERLYTIEKILFPPQTFFSPGLIIKSAKCSICDQEYGECNHVVGRPYMGEMCARIITGCEVTEISIVKDPANKRARVIKIQEGNVERDFLSWHVLPNPASGKLDE